MYIYTYRYIYIYTNAYVWPRRIEHRRSASAPHRAPAAEGGTYPEQSRHRRGVPRADVRAERRRPAERLQAEPHAVHADGKRSKVRREFTCACVCVRACVRVCVRAHTTAPKHTNTHTHTHKCTRDFARAHTHTHTRTHIHRHERTHTSTPTHPSSHTRTHPQTPTWTHTCAPGYIYLSISTCIDMSRYTALSVRTCARTWTHTCTYAHTDCTRACPS
jgi:hypothetical protein